MFEVIYEKSLTITWISLLIFVIIHQKIIVNITVFLEKLKILIDTHT